MLTNEEALLRTVLENPNDDAPRLVLADYLEERGDESRAEFIRVQIELAKYEAYCDVVDRYPIPRSDRLDALRRRERALLDEPRNFCNWVPLWLHQGSGVGIRRGPGTSIEFTGGLAQSLEFRRGFPSHVTLTLDALCGATCERTTRGSQCSGGEIRLLSGAIANCPRCRGTGRTEGIARELFSRCPIESLTISDKEANAGFWYNADRPEPYVGGLPESELPYDLWRLLDGVPDGDRTKRFDSPTAAHAAMSAAVVQWGRGLVGLV